jgi:hypothetical protein
MVLAGSPDFVEKEGAGLVGTTMQVKSQAPLFLARWRNKSTEFGFEKDVLAFLGAKRNDKRNGTFRELCDRGAVRAPPRGFAGFLFRHVGGDCTPNSVNGKENWNAPLVHLKVDATKPKRPASPCGRQAEDGPDKGNRNPRTQAEARATGAT